MGARTEVGFLSAAQIERELPGLKGTGYAITSAPTPGYNCIAWAAGDDKRWWWPSAHSFWPHGVARDITLDAFINAYGTLGYALCDNDRLEHGFEKVAIFVSISGAPTHAARQLGSGMWTSKLGKAYDIAHVLSGVEGLLYGRVAALLRRPKP